MSAIAIVILLVVMAGGGFGHSRWGFGVKGVALDLLLIAALVLWLLRSLDQVT
jgi:hypothetical protein